MDGADAGVTRRVIPDKTWRLPDTKFRRMFCPVQTFEVGCTPVPWRGRFSPGTAHRVLRHPGSTAPRCPQSTAATVTGEYRGEETSESGEERHLHAEENIPVNKMAPVGEF
jgi:hypothetical protein